MNFPLWALVLLIHIIYNLGFASMEMFSRWEHNRRFVFDPLAFAAIVITPAPIFMTIYVAADRIFLAAKGR